MGETKIEPIVYAEFTSLEGSVVRIADVDSYGKPDLKCQVLVNGAWMDVSYGAREGIYRAFFKAYKELPK
jgi:hypothetical protein